MFEGLLIARGSTCTGSTGCGKKVFLVLKALLTLRLYCFHKGQGQLLSVVCRFFIFCKEAWSRGFFLIKMNFSTIFYETAFEISQCLSNKILSKSCLKLFVCLIMF